MNEGKNVGRTRLPNLRINTIRLQKCRSDVMAAQTYGLYLLLQLSRLPGCGGGRVGVADDLTD